MFFRNILFFLLFLPVGVCVAQTEDNTEREPLVDEFVQVDKMPETLNLDSVKMLVRYPERLREAKIQGKVFVKILVDKNGMPVKHVVKRSPHPLITEEVERVVYHSRFSPALKQNKPVYFWTTFPVDFHLK